MGTRHGTTTKRFFFIPQHCLQLWSASYLCPNRGLPREDAVASLVYYTYTNCLSSYSKRMRPYHSKLFFFKSLLLRLDSANRPLLGYVSHLPVLFLALLLFLVHKLAASVFCIWSWMRESFILINILGVCQVLGSGNIKVMVSPPL